VYGNLPYTSSSLVLALLLPHLFGPDNDRVLGQDNAHGTHERHYMGAVEPVQFKKYLATAKRF